MIGGLIKRNDIVIYESTVFPGCTEEVCVPVLEKKSGLLYNKDFFVAIALRGLTREIKNILLQKLLKSHRVQLQKLPNL